jgi:glycosyltransferase involved in cell wall biosynthesis
MVHDLTPINHPEFCRVGESMRHTARIRAILTTAAGIVTNSRATLEALSRFAYASGLAMPPVLVAPLGCGLTAQFSRPNPADAPTPSGPYFVMLGTIEPRKNHWMILQVWRRMVDRYGSTAPKLLVIGQRGWKCENVLDLLERCAQLRGVVFELPNCSDTELACYLAGARALIFPSFDEGYGLPLIESLSLGVPVLASNLPVFREIAGDIPDYLDPLDGVGWMSCIEDYRLPNSPLRAAQLERLAGFIAPTWQGHFEAVDKLLGQIQNSI